MREAIDFQEGYESGEDGVEAPAKRHGILLEVSSRKLVYLKTGVEDFAEDPDEPSWIQRLADKIGEIKSEIRRRMFFAGAAHSMVSAFEFPANTFKFAMAFLKDVLDNALDTEPIDEEDRWRWTKRYPRVASHANMDHANFLKFQAVMARHIEIPDLTQPQKTAEEVNAEKAAEIAELRRQVELRKRAA